MVIDKVLLEEYISLYGCCKIGSEPCDRCGDKEISTEMVRRWMISHFDPGNRPRLCIDCARHYGLAW